MEKERALAVDMAVCRDAAHGTMLAAQAVRQRQDTPKWPANGA